MKRIAAVLAAGCLAAGAQPASALDLGLGLFKKKSAPGAAAAPKTESALKIKQLVATLQSDPDNERRKVAAEAMRTVDPRNNADAISTLVNTLQNDPNPGVRAIAAESLGAIKSVYPNAGSALENAEKSDPDANVRAMSKAALWQYHLNGYKTPTTSMASLPSQTGEPPLAVRRPVQPTTPTNPAPMPTTGETSFRPITQGMGKGVVYQPTAEPPLAKSKAPTTTVTDLKPPMPTIPAPPIPMPMPPVELNKPLPPLSIPDLPTIPSGSAVPTVIPPKK